MSVGLRKAMGHPRGKEQNCFTSVGIEPRTLGLVDRCSVDQATRPDVSFNIAREEGEGEVKDFFQRIS